MSVISGPPLEQEFHKCLSGVFEQLPTDRDIASVIKAKACSVKINGMLQIDHNTSVTLIETCVHFQGGYEGIKGLTGHQFPFTVSVDVDHMGKMLCVDYFPEGNLNITAVYLYIYVFPGIRDAGKDFICQCGNIIFTVGLYKIVQSPDLKSV